MTGQAIRYLLVGVSNTVITLAAYALAIAAGAPPVVASVIAFCAGAVNGYTRRVVKPGTDSERRATSCGYFVYRIGTVICFINIPVFINRNACWLVKAG